MSPSRGGIRPGAGRPKGSTGAGRPFLVKRLRVGETIVITLEGQQFGGHPGVEILMITSVDRDGMLTATGEDGTKVTIR